MFTIKSNGVDYEITSKVNVIEDLKNITPGLYRIKMHENFGGKELVVLIVASYVFQGTVHIVAKDALGDYSEVMYWNGGWKVDNLTADLDEWYIMMNMETTYDQLLSHDNSLNSMPESAMIRSQLK